MRKDGRCALTQTIKVLRGEILPTAQECQHYRCAWENRLHESKARLYTMPDLTLQQRLVLATFQHQKTPCARGRKMVRTCLSARARTATITAKYLTYMHALSTREQIITLLLHARPFCASANIIARHIDEWILPAMKKATTLVTKK